MTERAPVSVRGVLRLLWQTDSYPHLGNGDEREYQRLMDEALASAALAAPSLDDPPEFTQWLATLCDPKTSNDARDAVMATLHDLFDPDNDRGKSRPGAVRTSLGAGDDGGGQCST